MEVTRTSLRSQRNQKVPKQISQRQTRETGGYGDELKQQLQNIGDVRRREAPVIQAKKIEQIVSPTEQYTQDAVKTAMEKLKKFVVSQGLGGDTSGTPATTTPLHLLLVEVVEHYLEISLLQVEVVECLLKI